MKVRKDNSAKVPGYPSRREFIAAAGAAVLGLGAVAGGAEENQGSGRELGKIRVDPGQGGCKTNEPGGAAGQTNSAPAESLEPEIKGRIAAPREPAPRPAGVPRAPREAGEKAEAVSDKAATYTVKKGDTLSGIARSQLGDAGQWQRIVAENPGLKADALKAGMTIKLPGKKSDSESDQPRLGGEMPAVQVPGKIKSGK